MGEVGAGGGQRDRRNPNVARPFRPQPSAVPSKLRATAPSFVPQAWKERTLTHSSIQGSAEPVSSVGHPLESGLPLPPPCSLTDLPHDVLSSILSHLRRPQDVLAFGLASKLSLLLLSEAPLRLNFSTTLAESGGGGKLQEGFAHRAARSLQKYLQGAVHLDLSNRPVADQELEVLLHGLPKLRVIVLSGCKKLINPVPFLMRSLCGQKAPPTAPSPTPQDLPHPSAPPSPPAAQPHSCLQALDLQRCFQLDASALTNLLHASISLQPCLRGFSCLALSHLDLTHWPLGTLPYRPRRSLLSSAPPPTTPIAQPSAQAPGAGNAPPPTPAAVQPSAQSQGTGTPHSQPLSAPMPTAPSSQPAQPSLPPPGTHPTAPSPQPATHAPPSLSTGVGPASGTSHAAHEAQSTHSPRQIPQGAQGQEEATAGLQTLPGFAEAVAAALRLAPPQLPTRLAASPTLMASSLQVLALHCCELSEPCLISICLCCPKCKFLLLGGSSIQPPPAAACPSPPYASQLHLPHAYLQAVHEVRAAMASKLSGDPFVEGSMQAAFSSPPDPSLPRAAPESLTASGLRQQLRHARQHGAAVQEGSIGGAGSRAERSAAAAAARAGCVAAAAARSMPGLLVLELTMMPALTVHSARVGLGYATGSESEKYPSVSGSEGTHALCSRVQVWDLSDSEGVAGAAQMQREALARGSGSWHVHDHHAAREDAGISSSSSSSSSSSASQALSVDSLLLGLRCAANCSNAARFSPLHLLAVRGDALAVGQLLRLGAVPDARERSGSSALFLASYHGHVACIKVLLEAGADAQMSNVAGEQPLYIAALRGHVEAVRQLVGACKKRGSMWLEPRLYGDGWSPLMAAAVANRLDVAQTLLSEAGAEGVQAMLHATNKYGQTALHVAARKGSPRLLRLLLSFVGPGFVGLRDNSGETALDVARNHSHNDACWELVTVAHNQGRQGHLAWAAGA